MLTNIDFLGNLSGIARSKARSYETKTVNLVNAAQLEAAGWLVEKRNKKSVRLRREKARGPYLEDRVWSLFYRMRFSSLSGVAAATLDLGLKEHQGEKFHISVVAIDDEVAIAIACKSSAQPSRRQQFQQEVEKYLDIRERFTTAVRSQFPSLSKRQTVLAMFLSNVILSDADRERAKRANIIIFDDHDLAYYESLVEHLGPAAKYQFLAEMLPGKTVPGLAIRIPAIKTRMGGFNCYTFSISPEYLLKISYVSHRSKGKASDVSTYQRMLNKGRLKKIQEYISEDGIFPTNIVINIDKSRLQFQRIHQESSQDEDSGICGWLDIRAAYKSAWIIDGQHRLFAYSGHDRAARSRLSVLAFDGLVPSEQARLFIDINAKQKSVKQSLLQELYAELHWDADDPSVRVRAIISKAIQDLDSDPESPLYERIQTSDLGKDATRCISLTSLYGALEKTDFLIAKEKQRHIVEYGPLWAGDNRSTLKRTEFIIAKWLNTIKLAADDWWNKGAAEGGGLAMNDGVITCINVLRSVFQHLDKEQLIDLDNQSLFNTVQKYAVALGEYLGSLSEQERKAFRELRGIQGQTRRTRNCQQAIRQKIQDFNPAGLDQFLEQEKAQTNIRAKEIIDQIEQKLQKVVLDELRRECGEDESGWWMVGIPMVVRLKVSARFEEEGGKRGGKEHYFDLIDYSKIASQNWKIFESILGYGKSGSKDKRLAWLSFVNEKRKIVAHASSAVSLTIEELTELEEYERWLNNQIAAPLSDGKNSSTE
jgi:DGQHR domain-containing protein